MILAIVGSSKVHDIPAVERLVWGVLQRHAPSVVVSGGADGVDTIAVKVAEENNIPTVVLRPQLALWDSKNGAICYKQRNIMIAMCCDQLVRIASRLSKTYGSGWTRDQAAKMGKPTEEHTF